jgi:acetylornithine deacetylase/succinyl-diaminopimelate desuccinylase-like protein
VILERLHAWLDLEYSKIQEELFAFLRFKTISTDPAFLPEHLKCCQWLTHIFQEIQFKTDTIETSGLPLFYAENLSAGDSAPTVLVYGHYDVQPVDPLDLWKSDPFEPVEKQGNVYARGALDDKGQIFFAIAAARALLAVDGTLPVNLKFCIEGEEECGSVGLADSLPSLKEKFSADYLLVVDCGLPDEETPAINLGGRGITTMEVVLKGSHEDLHSGLYGGIAYNPNRALAELLAECWDESGRVSVPHFYDDVVEADKQLFAASSVDEKELKDAGIEAFAADKEISLLEANWFRPTLEINGMSGGYTGAGFKTVIPAEARAKISCRLVPDQDPKKIGELVADFLKKRVKKGIQIQVDVHHGGKPFCGSPDSLLAKAVAKAYVEIFNKQCLNTLSGGSIPIVSDLVHTTGAEVVGMGYGIPSDNMHAPNEHFGLDRFKKGILTVARAMHHLGKACRP